MMAISCYHLFIKHASREGLNVLLYIGNSKVMFFAEGYNNSCVPPIILHPLILQTHSSVNALLLCNNSHSTSNSLEP